MTTGRWRLSRDGLVALAVALAIWSALFLAILSMSGGGICSILTTVEQPSETAAPTPATPEEWEAYTRQRCDRVPWVPIAFFGAGYIVIAAVAIRSARSRKVDSGFADE